MKFYTHPKLKITSIQPKDGSFYIKRWVFFKSTLSLEVDFTSHKTWQSEEKKLYTLVKLLSLFKKKEINKKDANNSTINKKT